MIDFSAFRDELIKIAAGTPVFSMAVRGTMRPISSIQHQISTTAPRALTSIEQAAQRKATLMRSGPSSHLMPLGDMHPTHALQSQVERLRIAKERASAQAAAAVTPKMPSADVARLAVA